MMLSDADFEELLPHVFADMRSVDHTRRPVTLSDRVADSLAGRTRRVQPNPSARTRAGASAAGKPARRSARAPLPPCP